MNNMGALRYFADWYAAAHPGPMPELIELRLRCVDAAVAKLDTLIQVTNLVRCLGESDAAGSGATRQMLVGQFYAVDRSFPHKNNQNLVDVMVAGCIAKVIDQGGDNAILAALTLKAMAVHASRTVEPTDLVDVALEFLRREGGRVRDSAHQPHEALSPIREIAPIKVSILAIEEVQTNQWESINKVMKVLSQGISGTQKLLTSLGTAVQSLRDDVVGIAVALGPRLRDQAVTALQEETQVLWWLFGKWSEDGGGKFDQLRLPGAALVLGAEFARLLRFVPSHPRASSLIAKALETCDGSVDVPVALGDVIASSPVDWRKRLIGTATGVEAFTPILFALARSTEVPDGSWQLPFEAVTGMSVKTMATPVEWASRLCDELLLQRMLNNAPS